MPKLQNNKILVQINELKLFWWTIKIPYHIEMTLA